MYALLPDADAQSGSIDSSWMKVLHPRSIWQLMHGGLANADALGLPLLLEIDRESEALKAELQNPAKAQPSALGTFVLPAYISSDSKNVQSRFVVARVNRDCFKRVCPSYVKRAVLGIPMPNASRAQGFTDTKSVNPTQGSSPLVLGIIDDGCPFAHPLLQADPRSISGGNRVAFLWDQDSRITGESGTVRSGSLWKVPPDFKYGREAGTTFQKFKLPENALSTYVEEFRGDPGGLTDERGCYQTAHYMPSNGVRSHGMGVIDTLLNSAEDWPASVKQLVQNAVIIFVQLPRATAADSSGTSLGAHVIDALHYIDSRSKMINAERMLVVNLSFGAMAGSHDGKGLVESAIDAFLSEHPDVGLLVAAGNAAARQCHARVSCEARESVRFDWVSMPGDPHNGVIEFWVRRSDVTNSIPRTLSLDLEVPGEDSDSIADTIHLGECKRLVRDKDSVGWVAYHPIDESGAGLLQMVLAPTVANPGDDGIVGPVGAMRLRVCCPDAPVRIDAYVERDDALHQGSSNARFFTGDNVTSQDTLTSIATAKQPVVVGISDRYSGRPLEYSGRGGEHRQPDLHLAVDDGRADDASVLLNGFYSGAYVRFGGTSLAAPKAAARLIASMLDKRSTDDRNRTNPAPEKRVTTGDWFRGQRVDSLRPDERLDDGL